MAQNADAPSSAGPAQSPQGSEGTYRDMAEHAPVAAKVDYMPKGPDPMPFVLTGKGGGR